jgi:hypothetical protein
MSVKWDADDGYGAHVSVELTEFKDGCFGVYLATEDDYEGVIAALTRQQAMKLGRVLIDLAVELEEVEGKQKEDAAKALQKDSYNPMRVGEPPHDIEISVEVHKQPDVPPWVREHLRGYYTSSVLMLKRQAREAVELIREHGGTVDMVSDDSINWRVRDCMSQYWPDWVGWSPDNPIWSMMDPLAGGSEWQHRCDECDAEIGQPCKEPDGALVGGMVHVRRGE